MSEKQNDGGVKVKDKRRFSMEDGEVKMKDGEKETKPSETEKSGESEKITEDSPKEPKAAGGQTEGKKEPEALPPVSFSSLIFSLSTSAMMYLGDLGSPEGKTVKDVALAKQSIDLLGVLSEKTKGNLTKEEEEFLSHSLRDLRLRFVQVKE